MCQYLVNCKTARRGDPCPECGGVSKVPAEPAEVGTGFCCQCGIGIEAEEAFFESDDAEKDYPLCEGCCQERERQAEQEHGQAMRDAYGDYP